MRKQQHVVASGVRDTLRDTLSFELGDRTMIIPSRAWGFPSVTNGIGGENTSRCEGRGLADEGGDADTADGSVEDQDWEEVDAIPNVETKSERRLLRAISGTEMMLGQKRRLDVNDEDITPTTKRRRHQNPPITSKFFTKTSLQYHCRRDPHCDTS